MNSNLILILKTYAFGVNFLRIIYKLNLKRKPKILEFILQVAFFSIQSFLIGAGVQKYYWNEYNLKCYAR